MLCYVTWQFSASLKPFTRVSQKIVADKGSTCTHNSIFIYGKLSGEINVLRRMEKSLEKVPIPQLSYRLQTVYYKGKHVFIICVLKMLFYWFYVVFDIPEKLNFAISLVFSVIIHIKRNKTWTISFFELNYKNRWTFQHYSNLIRRTCIPLSLERSHICKKTNRSLLSPDF